MESDNDDEDWNKPVDETINQHIISYNSQKTITDTTHPRVILHIDIDCFYAQVEMLRNPALKNKPLGRFRDKLHGIQQKYIIVTCNYVAREQGLTKLMTVKDALGKCPDLVLVSGEDLTNYRQMSYKISNYLQKYCPLVERLGFDENFLDITDLVNDRIHNQSVPLTTEVKGHVYMSEVNIEGSCDCGCQTRLIVGSQIAAEIRAGLLKELGITCCGGVAHNKLLSKLVASTHKPNQQTTLFPQFVDMLMSSLKSVRNIQGIGHTTARRLKELGVVTVSDLQNIERSVLEEEFGQASVETMKKLCAGIDDSPVTAFGLPQTLSDEDSFKKCSNVEDARTRIQQLVNSLLLRLLEDGRRPQTFRLSVRRMLETNRYNNRESRQCNIPSSVFNKFAADNLIHASRQLEAVAYSLFTKMVDIKSPFHLTLINVAFAKLEQKSSNDISNFFSPKKTTSQRTDSVEIADNCQNVATDSFTAADKHKEMETSIDKIETCIDNKLGGSALENRKSSPGVSPKKRVSGIEKWLVKQPSGNKQTCSNSCQTTVCAGEMEESSRTKRSLKRLSSDCGYIDNERNVAKRKCEHYSDEVGSFKLPSNVAEILPPDLDLNVFLELPSDIQKDILDNTGIYGNSELKKPSKPNPTTCMDRSGFKASFEMPCSSISNDFKNSLHENCKRNENINITERKPNTGGKAVDERTIVAHCKNIQDETSLGASVKVSRDVQGTSDKQNAQGFIGLSKTISKLDKKTAENLHVDSKTKEDNCETVIIVPGDVDPAVFESLPPDIKNELIKQWNKDKPAKTPCIKEPKQQDKPFFRSPKPSSCSSITDYFLRNDE